MTRFHRAGAGLVVALALGACIPSKAEMMTLEEAKTQAPRQEAGERLRYKPQVELNFPTEPVQVANQWWQVTATDFRIPAQQLQQVGMAGGATFYVMRGERAPYSRLLAASPVQPGHYQEFLPVSGYLGQIPQGARGPVHLGAPNAVRTAASGAAMDDHGAH